MRGTIGLIVGIVIIGLGLAGLSISLNQMMTHANPNGDLISVVGLGVFALACVFMLFTAYRS